MRILKHCDLKFKKILTNLLPPGKLLMMRTGDGVRLITPKALRRKSAVVQGQFVLIFQNLKPFNNVRKLD